MLHIKILTVGKLKEKYLHAGILEYAKRLNNYCKLEFIEVADEKTFENSSDKENDLILEKEAERILNKLTENDFVFALAIEGDLVTSEKLANYIDSCALHGKSKLVFIIGGSLGLHTRVKKRAQQLISFGRITMPHQLIRLVVTEQIYRSFRIINNEPYHK